MTLRDLSLPNLRSVCWSLLGALLWLVVVLPELRRWIAMQPPSSPRSRKPT